MKILKLKVIIVYTMIGLFISCDMNDPNDGDYNVNPRSGWIQFQEDSLQGQVNSTDSIFQIPFDINIPVNDNGFVVSYSVEAIEGTAPDSQIGSFTTTVEKVKQKGFIDILLDENVTGNYTLQVQLMGVDNEDIKVGILGTDRPIAFELLVCSNNLPLNWTGSSFIGNSEIGSFDLTLTPTDEPNEYLIDNAWGNFVAAATGDPSLEGQFPYPATLVQNDDNSINIIGSDTSGPFPGGSGSFDPCSNELQYSLQQDLFQGDFNADVVLNPSN